MSDELAALFLAIAARLRRAADDYERRAREWLASKRSSPQ